MLVLGRRVNEGILIGDDIRVVIVRVGSKGAVRLGIEAPDDVRIIREEITRYEHPGGESDGDANCASRG